MKHVSRFKTDDGREFQTETEAAQHERVIGAVLHANAAMPMPPAFDTLNWSNGEGYFQRTPQQLAEFITRLEAAIRLECGDKMADTFKARPREWGYVARCLDDGGNLCYGPIGRIQCVDAQHREFGQAFYALNPDQAQLFEIKL